MLKGPCNLNLSPNIFSHKKNTLTHTHNYESFGTTLYPYDEWLGLNSKIFGVLHDEIKPFVLEKAPKNNKMTSHDIQKDIVTACKIETIKAIIEDINSDYVVLLVDESRDMSRKEQMAICL